MNKFLIKHVPKLFNLYAPLLGAGIKVKHIAPGFAWIDVEMKLRLWNKNIVGVHFGGSLYAMCDPFFMMILMQRLGPDFTVWDKAASIRFRRPGKGTVRARFEVSDQELDQIRQKLLAGEKVEPVFKVNVVDTQGEIVAEVSKTLWVARKKVPSSGPHESKSESSG